MGGYGGCTALRIGSRTQGGSMKQSVTFIRSAQAGNLAVEVFSSAHHLERGKRKKGQQTRESTLGCPEFPPPSPQTLFW
jgi:hypothetical protein